MRQQRALFGALVVGALVLVSCGGDDSTGATATTAGLALLDRRSRPFGVGVDQDGLLGGSAA